MKLVTIADIAAELGVPVHCVRYAAQKVPPTKVVGTAYLYGSDAVKRIVAERERIESRAKNCG